MKLPENLQPFYRVLTDDEVDRVHNLKYTTPTRCFHSNKRANFLRKRGADVRWHTVLKKWLWHPGSDVCALFFCPKCGGRHYTTKETVHDTSHGGNNVRSTTGYCANDCGYWFSLGYTGTVCSGRFQHNTKECMVTNVIKRIK